MTKFHLLWLAENRNATSTGAAAYATRGPDDDA
jgi:hypothetical protein